MAGEFIPLNLGADWIAKLWSKLQSIKNYRREELETINNVFGNPNDLAKYYIEPDCQDTNPADTEVEDLLGNYLPVMTKIDEFLAAAVPNHPGYNVLFVLGDAGMGKTALLTMIKLMHLTSFWPKGKGCGLKKLSPETLGEIKQISNKFETILLLDSLDEDTSAYGRVKDRLIEILDATNSFYRVIITCRTQFFPDSEGDHLERLNKIIIGGYRCRAKYLSFFDDKHVQAFLKKRFPKRYKIIPQKKLIEDAQKTIKKMGSLRCRPMLLAYIGDLIPSPELKAESNEFAVYSSLVNNWLQREHIKTKIPAKDLLRACEILATELTMNQVHSISEQQLDDLIEKYRDIRQIKAIDIKGRSLLNRNSEGEYRFAHNSFREFLVARRVLYNIEWEPKQRIPATGLMLSFVIQGTRITQQKARLQLMDISYLTLLSVDLNNVNLNGTILSGADLSRADLSRADLSRADLSGANLSGANLSGANLSGANLIGAVLNGTILNGVDLSDANLNSTDLRNARLNSAILIGAILSGANLSGVDLNNTNLDNAYLIKADLSLAVLIGADLRQATLTNADLSLADLSSADLRDATFVNADLSLADLRDAYLSSANLSGAKLSGAKLSREQLNSKSVRGADISEVIILE